MTVEPVAPSVGDPVYQPVAPLAFLRQSDPAERLLLLTAWVGTILLGVAMGLASIVFEWSGLPVHFAGVDVYVDLYPPLIFSMIWTLWFGFWWGFVPAYLSTLVLALYSGMSPLWAALFAFADPLGLALFAMAYRAVPLSYGLRSLNSVLFFVMLSFVGGIFGSTGALVWVNTSGIGSSQVLPIWEGWWLGAFVQNLLVVAPLLALFSPMVNRWRTERNWGRAAENLGRRHALMGAGAILAGVLLFLYLSVHLNIQHYQAVAAGGTASAVQDAARTLTESTQALYWVMASIILFASYFGVQAFQHWTASVRRSARILASTNADLLRAKDQAEEAARAKSSFLATMSHEIRTPMNGVISLAEILTQTRLDGEQQGLVSVLRESANALLTVINDILDFSKIEAGKLELEFIPFSLVETVESVVSLMSSRAEEKGLSLSIWVDPALPDQRCGDPMRLRQVLINLTGNAIKFTNRGRIDIEVIGAGNDDVTISVQDTGIGLPSEQQEQLFQPFSQLDASTSRKFGGTGLGLSISRRLVQLMGGEIGVSSKPGHGARFWFTIPLAYQMAAEESAPPNLAGVRIAVVDGPDAEKSVLWRYLAYTGAKLTSVPEQSDALSALKQQAVGGQVPDVVLIDAISHADGIHLGTALMAEPCMGSAKMILLASMSQISALSQAQQNGFYAALPRPVQRQRLWRAVGGAVQRIPLDDAFQLRPEAPKHFAPPKLSEARAAGAAILVAEDNPTNQLVLTKVLERLGYASVMVANGVEALELLAKEHFALLITDCHMPVMDGFELSRRLRARPIAMNTGIPILALTADALKGTEELCRNSGMNDYLSKPVETACLDAAIQRWAPQAARLRKPVSEPAPISPVKPRIGAALNLERIHLLFGAVNDEAREMLELLRQTVGNHLDEIRRSLEEGDAVTAARHAHSAAGASGNAGADELGRLCSQVELLLHENKPAEAKAALQALSSAYERLAAEITDLLAAG